MTFWIVAALILLATTAALLWPLLRRRTAMRDAADFDVEVYRDQLRQIDRDLAEGQIDDAAAEAARAEVGRRLLAADARREAADAAPRARPDKAVAVAVGILVPVCAVLLYTDLGQPDLPGFPFAERTSQTGDRTAEIEVLRKQLLKHLKREPTDMRAWSMLGQAYKQLGQYDKAAEIYGKALTLDGGNPTLMAARAEALVLAAKGIVTPEAQQTFETVLEKDVRNPRAQFYLAVADEQAGRMQAALGRWKTLLTSAPPGAPWVAMARERATKTANALGLDPAAALPPPASGPTAGDVASAQGMSPQDRQTMIESMVEGLAAKLEENPEDLNGWLRLGRSYSVLKKNDEARDALAKAAALAPENPEVLLLYGRTIRAAAGGKQTPESIAVMRRVLAVDPKNIEALWLVGTAEAEAGDRAAGTAKMQEALDQLPPGTPNRDALAERLEALKTGK
ncbi:MAG: c-type cytochrome biogenesis protein CcmI [Gammaproteobacteria bacterium]|jgi:cytochrome c-type biogenesis protein CcmH